MAAGVGSWDEFVRTAGWDVGRQPPMALGVEAAGTVLAAGNAAREWAPGDAVMTHPVPLREQGTWAPRLIAPAGLLARKPADVSWAAAAAFPVPALTARQVLVDALGLHAGDQLLVNGSSGATGNLLVTLAVLHGAQVIAMAGPTSRERVAALGADHVIDYHDPDWASQVRALTGGRGVTAAVNASPCRLGGRAAGSSRRWTARDHYRRPAGPGTRRHDHQRVRALRRHPACPASNPTRRRAAAVPGRCAVSPRRRCTGTRPGSRRPRRGRHHPDTDPGTIAKPRCRRRCRDQRLIAAPTLQHPQRRPGISPCWPNVCVRGTGRSGRSRWPFPRCCTLLLYAPQRDCSSERKKPLTCVELWDSNPRPLACHESPARFRARPYVA